MTEPLGCRGGLSRARDGEIDVGTTEETPGRSSGGIDVEVVRGGGSHTPLLTRDVVQVTSISWKRSRASQHLV